MLCNRPFDCLSCGEGKNLGGYTALGFTGNRRGPHKTYSCSTARTSVLGITPLTMRDVVIQEGFDAGERSNFLAEIHNVLKRLVAQGEAEEITDSDGGKAYRQRLPVAFRTWLNQLREFAGLG